MHSKDTTGLFPARCPMRTFCPSVSFALYWTLHRHGLREGVVLTSVGTRVQDYRSFGESPVGTDPCSYRTLGGVPGGGVAWCLRRRCKMPMCSARKTAGQHLVLRHKGLDIDAKYATKPHGMYQRQCTASRQCRSPIGPTQCRKLPGAPYLSRVYAILQTILPEGVFRSAPCALVELCLR